MNIFYLNSDPKLAAAEVCSVHVRKMIIESIQMLSTAHHVLDLGVYKSKDLLALELESKWFMETLMRPTHVNHPSNIWVRQNKNHYQWLASYTEELLKIYKEDTGKTHACELNRMEILKTFPKNIPTGAFTPPPMSMPDEFKHRHSVVRAYRTYLNEKYNEWLSRERPIKVVFPKGQPEWLTLT